MFVEKRPDFAFLCEFDKPVSIMVCGLEIIVVESEGPARFVQRLSTGKVRITPIDPPGEPFEIDPIPALNGTTLI